MNMKRFKQTALLCCVFLLLLCPWAFASGTKTGIYDLQCAAGVTVAPQTAAGAAIAQTSLTVGENVYSFYENAERFDVSVSGAAAEYYVIMVLSDTDAPNADNIRYIDQASPVNGTVSFGVFPDKLMKGTTYYVYLSGSGEARTQIASFSCYDSGCVVSFDSNGGTGTMAAQTIDAGTAGTLNANIFTRAGYSFNGWNTKADGTGTAYGDGATVTLTADLTLYAQWKQANPLAVSSIAPSTTSAHVNDSVTWTVTATGGEAPYKYRYYVYKDGAEVTKSSYITASSYSYTPTETGSYTVKVFVKDSAGISKSKQSAAVKVMAQAQPLVVSSIAPDKTSAPVGQSVTWTASATGGEAPYKYRYYVYKDGALVTCENHRAANDSRSPPSPYR